jgi:xanthine/uracil permease
MGGVILVGHLKLKYGLDEVPPVLHLLAFSMQWLAITVPTIIIVGKVAAGIQPETYIEPTLYLQRIFFVVSVSLLIQTLLGHRMPLVVGPAAVLLIGIAASEGSSSSYSAILICGLILAVLGITGLFAHLRKFFTPRVVATTLILIAFTLTPMILDLITSSVKSASPFNNLVFSLSFVLIIFIFNKFLTGIWKSTLILWSIILGSLAYYFIFGVNFSWGGADTPYLAGFLHGLDFSVSVEPGVLISFLICFLALSVNDLGSIQSVGEMLKPDNMQKRITRGITLTGLLNVLAGMFGVIGLVNFSLSPGVIASTRVASRFTLIPTALGLLLLSFLPKTIAFMGSIPSAVIGATMIYIMCSQIGAGLIVAFNSNGGFKFENGIVMGLPLMLSILISFLPQEVLHTFPLSLRPILGNGFVVGIIAVLIMEHIIYREKKV